MLVVGTEKAYNIQEAAEMLKVTPTTVRTYIKQGKIKAQRVGRALHITEENLQNFLKGDVANE